MNRFFCGLASIGLGVFPVVAATNAPVAKASGGTTNALAPVVVTATRITKYRPATVRSATLTDAKPEEVPVTVDVLSEEYIRDRNPTDLDNLLSFQPGIYQGGKTVMARTAGQYNIRGQYGSEVLLNGLIPLGPGMGTFLDTYMLDRVEIVKGPVGSTFGGQTQSLGPYGAGGSIILYEKRPEPDPFIAGEFRSAFGSTIRRYRLMGDVNEPLLQTEGGSSILSRLPISIDYYKPFWLDPCRKWSENYTMAPSLLFEPTEDVRFGVDTLISYMDAPAYQGIFTKYGRPAPGFSWDTDYATDDLRDRLFSSSVMPWLEWDATEDFTIRTGGGYSYSYLDWQHKGPHSTLSSLADELSFGRSEDERYNAYLNGVYTLDTDPLVQKFLLGFDFTRKEDTSDSSDWSSKSVAAARDESKWTSSRSGVNKYGILAQDELSLGDFRGLAGIRNDYHYSDYGNYGSSFSPRGGLSYLITDWLIPYVNFSKTSAPNFGYFNSVKQNKQSELTEPWNAYQYEGGLRVAPVKGFWLGAAVYQLDQENTPVAINPTSRNSAYTLEGKNRSQGVELSASGDITKNWSVFAAYTIQRYEDRSNDISFDRFPRNSVSLYTTYKVDELLGGTVFGFGYRFRDKWYLTQRGEYAGDDYYAEQAHVFDASMEIPIPRSWYLGQSSILFAVKNIFDDRYIESARNMQAFPGDPRTFEVAVRTRF